MTPLFHKLKRVASMLALLLIGFAAGWLSAGVLGGHLPVTSGIAGLLGPGLVANQATPAQLREQFGVFWQVWNIVENEFYHVEPLDRSRMIRGAISGMLASLDDPYTLYQEPELASQTNDHMQGTLEGIGAYINVIDGRAYISKVFKNSPALGAGLQANDEIIAVDDVLIADLIADLDTNQAAVKVASKIRGPQGSIVKLRIGRADQEPFEVSITRAQVIVGSVEGQMLDDKLAYIKITEFKATTTREFDDILRELLPKKPQGIVLDLRNNPGGYLQNAQEVLGRFYDGTALFETNGQGELKELSTIGGGRDVRVFDLPLVVLVNGGSASASEIVAGALRDARQFTYLIGEKTFGKGSVQNIHQLMDGGSARVTIAHWLTPAKITINKEGIVPQYVVPYNEDISNPVPCVGERQPAEGQTSCADSQLAAAMRLLLEGKAPVVVEATQQ